MDIEFLVQDTFHLTRPQWKLAAGLDEAVKAFQLAVAQDQKSAGVDKTADMDDATSDPSSDDDNGDNDDVDGDDNDESASEEEDADVSQASTKHHRLANKRFQDVEEESDSESTFEEEAIVVTRQEEEVDPEDEADFEREYAKLMAESLESRKFERKQLFDVPLPVRAKNRETPSSAEGASSEAPPSHTMAFSLLTKKGNRQQVGRFPLARIMTVMANPASDTNCRVAIRLDFCDRYEEPAAG